MQAAGPGFVGNPLGFGAGASVKIVGDVSKITPEQKAKLRAMGVDLDALIAEQTPEKENQAAETPLGGRPLEAAKIGARGLLRPGPDSLRVGGGGGLLRLPAKAAQWMKNVHAASRACRRARGGRRTSTRRPW